MSSIVAIAHREVKSHAFVFYGSLVLGIIPILLSFLPYWGSAPPSDIRGFTALLMGSVTALGASILLGASTFGTGLSERRAAFDFVRPISATSIWAGKVAGALTVLYGSLALAYVPGRLFGSAPQDEGILWLTLMLAPLALFFLSNAISISLRSKTGWLTVDLVAFAALAGVTWLPLSRLAERSEVIWQWQTPLRIVTGAGVAGFLVLVTASLVLVLRGRIDLATCHKTQTLLLWPALLVLSLGVDIYSRWLVSASLEDLAAEFSVLSDPTGRWAAVWGSVPRKGVLHAFLADLKTGASFELNDFSWGGLVFSGDGRRAAWIAREGVFEKRDTLLTLMDLSAPEPAKSRLTFPISPKSRSLTLSPDGTRVIVAWEDAATILDAVTGNTVGSFRLPYGKEAWAFLAFNGNDSVRVIPVGGSSSNGEFRTFPILEFDISQKTLRKTGEMAHGSPTASTSWLRLSPDGTRFLLTTGSASQERDVTLFDARTGSLIQRIETAKTGITIARFLSDGRILVPRNPEGGPRFLDVRGPDGQLLRTLKMAPPRHRVWHGLEIAPGRFLAGIGPAADGVSLDSWKPVLHVVDVDAGTVTSLDRPFAPAVLTSWWYHLQTAAQGSEASRLVLSTSGKLIQLGSDLKSVRPLTNGEKKRLE